MYCSKCGHQNAEGQKFCSKCGESLMSVPTGSGSEVSGSTGSSRSGINVALQQHMGLILGILGLIAFFTSDVWILISREMWFLIIQEIVLGVIGIIVSREEKDGGLRLVAIMCCTIAIAFWIVASLEWLE